MGHKNKCQCFFGEIFISAKKMDERDHILFPNTNFRSIQCLNDIDSQNVKSNCFIFFTKGVTRAFLYTTTTYSVRKICEGAIFPIENAFECKHFHSHIHINRNIWYRTSSYTLIYFNCQFYTVNSKTALRVYQNVNEQSRRLLSMCCVRI